MEVNVFYGNTCNSEINRDWQKLAQQRNKVWSQFIRFQNKKFT